MTQDEAIKLTKKYKKPKCNYFYEYKIDKKDGGTRNINAYYKKELKEQHQLLNKRLQGKHKNLDIHCYGVGFSGFDLVESAKRHKDNDYFFNFDFGNFFETLHVSYLFKQYSPEELGLDDSDIRCILKGTDSGRLVQGSVLAPTIANLIMIKVDEEIVRNIGSITKKYKYDKGTRRPIYTRYADDITISYPAGFYDTGVYLGINNGKRNHICKPEHEFSTFKQYLYPSKLRQYEIALENIILNAVHKILFDSEIQINYRLGGGVRLNHKKTRSCNLSKSGHYKLLSWNIVKGKDGQSNYVTAGRQANRRGYYGYQENSFKKSEAIKNTRQVNLKYLESKKDTSAMINYYTSHHNHTKDDVLKIHMLLTATYPMIENNIYYKTINEKSTNYVRTYLYNLLKEHGVSEFFDCMNVLNKMDNKEYEALTGGYNE